MFTYTLKSWLLANLIHPLLAWLFFLAIRFGSSEMIDSFGFAFNGFLSFLFCSLIFSIPVLFLSWFVLGLIADLDQPVRAKFYMLLAYAAAVLFFVAIVIVALFLPQAPSIFLGFIPAILSAVFALLIRYEQFKKLFANEIR